MTDNDKTTDEPTADERLGAYARSETERPCTAKSVRTTNRRDVNQPEPDE